MTRSRSEVSHYELRIQVLQPRSMQFAISGEEGIDAEGEWIAVQVSGCSPGLFDDYREWCDIDRLDFRLYHNLKSTRSQQMVWPEIAK
jgi:hypothetical protein